MSVQRRSYGQQTAAAVAAAGENFGRRGSGRKDRRAAAKRSGPLPEKLTPVKRANVMDQVGNNPWACRNVTMQAHDLSPWKRGLAVLTREGRPQPYAHRTDLIIVEFVRQCQCSFEFVTPYKCHATVADSWGEALLQRRQFVRPALQFMPTDLSGIAVEAQTLDGLTFAFCDHGSAGKAEVESMVTRLGGKVPIARYFAFCCAVLYAIRVDDVTKRLPNV